MSLFNSQKYSVGTNTYFAGGNMLKFWPCISSENFVLELPGSFFSFEVPFGWSLKTLPFSWTGFYIAKYSRGPLFKLLELFPCSLDSVSLSLQLYCFWYCFLCLWWQIARGSVWFFLLCWVASGWEPWMMVGLISYFHFQDYSLLYLKIVPPVLYTVF